MSAIHLYQLQKQPGFCVMQCSIVMVGGDVIFFWHTQSARESRATSSEHMRGRIGWWDVLSKLDTLLHQLAFEENFLSLL